jgi:hypothetical protein
MTGPTYHRTVSRSLMPAFALVLVGLAGVDPAAAAGAADRGLEPRAADVVAHWTAERRARALPRDLVIDARGLGYLRRPDGSLTPYGHTVAAAGAENAPAPRAKPGTGDTTPPSISNMDPGAGQTIGDAYVFSATVTDASGIKSVNFIVQKDGSLSQSFSASSSGGDTYSASLQGFTDGQWTWWVEAKDNGPRGGNTATSSPVGFSVDTGGDPGGDPGGGGDVIANAQWPFDGAVQLAAGRIYFEMPANARWKGPWNGYVCSGTVATDGTNGRSIIITAAHCVYDDANKAFARNVLFIPDQDGTTASGTDLNCSNDPIGCWAPRFGVVDVNWTTRTFPDNIPWDYAFYVVDDTGAHSPGYMASSEVLDVAAGSLAPSFSNVSLGSRTHALGYSYSDDPNFMYCAEDMTTEGSDNWWLPSCGMSGGSSGGPWVQPMDESDGSGPIISVNSWGYTGSPGMAGPKLVGTSASCLFAEAKTDTSVGASPPDGKAGVAATCQ